MLALLTFLIMVFGAYIKCCDLLFQLSNLSLLVCCIFLRHTIDEVFDKFWSGGTFEAYVGFSDRYRVGELHLFMVATKDAINFDSLAVVGVNMYRVCEGPEGGVIWEGNGFLFLLDTDSGSFNGVLGERQAVGVGDRYLYFVSVGWCILGGD